jgi:hypothetical protein
VYLTHAREPRRLLQPGSAQRRIARWLQLGRDADQIADEAGEDCCSWSKRRLRGTVESEGAKAGDHVGACVSRSRRGEAVRREAHCAPKAGSNDRLEAELAARSQDAADLRVRPVPLGDEVHGAEVEDRVERVAVAVQSEDVADVQGDALELAKSTSGAFDLVRVDVDGDDLGCMEAIECHPDVRALTAADDECSTGRCGVTRLEFGTDVAEQESLASRFVHHQAPEPVEPHMQMIPHRTLTPNIDPRLFHQHADRRVALGYLWFRSTALYRSVVQEGGE